MRYTDYQDDYDRLRRRTRLEKCWDDDGDYGDDEDGGFFGQDERGGLAGDDTSYYEDGVDLDERVLLNDEDAELLERHTPRGGEGDHRRDLGRLGEDIALGFLEDRGFTIVERNWTCQFGEADIIARDEDDTLAFIEVKTRSGLREGFPEEAVDYDKRLRYERIAAAYLKTVDTAGSFPVRFDVVSILVLGPRRAFLRHHRNAFYSVD